MFWKLLLYVNISMHMEFLIFKSEFHKLPPSSLERMLVMLGGEFLSLPFI